MSAPKHFRFAPLGLCVALWLSAAGHAEEALKPQENRITDEVVTADMKTLKSLQDRIAALNGVGGGADNYFLVKAQAWLDFANHEYYENERTGVIEGALQQSQWLVHQLEVANNDITLDTPVIPGSKRMREDLWRLAAELKQHQGFSCAAAPLAEFEVRLVWAGHEYQEMGWRHAREHFAAAERLARQAQKLADHCICPPVPDTPCSKAAEPPAPVEPPPVVLPPPVEPVVVPVPEKPAVPSLLVNVPRNVHFGLNKYDLNPRAIEVLKRISAMLKAYPAMNITLVGHTDPRASRAYNMKLSQRRAESVRDWLIKQGILPSRMTIDAEGFNQLVTDNDQLMSHALSRRVEVVYSGQEIVSFAQNDDIELENARKAGKLSPVKGKAVPRKAGKSGKPPRR